MSSWLEIDAGRLRLNLGEIRSLLAPGTQLMTVVKANAYGHGLEPVARATAGATDWFGVNALEEAQALFRLDLGKPILILGHTPAESAAEVVAAELHQVLYRLDVAEALSRAASEQGKPALVHVKIETGTNRQGVPVAELPEFIARVQDPPGISIEGVYTHFANIEDTLDPSYARLQMSRFQDALAVISRLGVRPRVVHAAATAGAILYPETHCDLVRIGIGAYGIWPSRETQIAARERGRSPRLAPVLAWKTRVAQVKRVEPGEYVGYGLTYQAPRAMRVAVIPVGYYDGYDRRLSNCGRALVRGRVAPVVGRVAMNMTVLDVTDAGASEEDEVVLLGRQASAEIRVEEVAEKVGTIPYEVLCRIHPHIPRRVVERD